MKKELFDRVLIKKGKDSDDDIRLTYYLLTDVISKGFCDLEVFGVEIDMEVLSERGSITEIKQVKNLFLKKSDIYSFMEMIVRNEVTPVGLKYIIKEYIDDWIDIHAVGDA